LANRRIPWPSPQTFDEIAPATAKDEQMATMRIALKPLLHHQRKAVEPFPMSAPPVASHTRTPAGIGIIGAKAP
jgi:hypothetical protein